MVVMDSSIVKDDCKYARPEHNSHRDQLDELKTKAQQMFTEGNSLQSLEYYAEILAICPQDQEALEGRLAACIKLKLFHRCLRDLETLAVINPDDPKVHHFSGFVHEQVGIYDKSLSAYLKAYLLDTEHRQETANIISKICYLMTEGNLDENLKGEPADALELLVSLSRKLFQKEKFQVCIDMLITALMAHCLDETALKVFKENLDICSIKDNMKAETFPETSTSAKDKVTAQTSSETSNSTKDKMKEATFSETSSSVKDVNMKAETTFPETSNFSEDNIKAETMNSVKVNMKSESSKTSNAEKQSECLTRKPQNLTFLGKIDPNTVDDVLSQISECCYRLGRMHTSFWLAEKCVENAQFSGNFTNELKAYSKLAILCSKSGQHDLSISYNTQVLSKCREKLFSLPDNQEGQSLRFQVSVIERETSLRLCLLFKELALYKVAEQFVKEYFLQVQIVDQDSLVKAYGILGETERLQGLYEESAKSHRTELALCLKFNDRRGIALAYSNLGKVHQASGHNVLAMECYDLHLKIATALTDKLSEAIAYGRLGEGFASRNNLKRALSCFEKQLLLAKANNQRFVHCQALQSLGVCYQSLGLFQHAESFLRRALIEAHELNMNEEQQIKQSLIEVLLTLGKANEALPLLFEVLEYLESMFNRIRGYKVIIRHPVLDELNRCVDDILELLAAAGRVEDALVLAERSNSMVFHQMIEHKAFVDGSELGSSEQHTFLNLQELVSSHKKIVLYYRVVKNGYMAWVMVPSHQGVAHFHWYRAPLESSFQESFEENINSLLKPNDALASYSCDHRKLYHISHEATPVATETRRNDPAVNSNDSTDFLGKLSKLFLFPIEKTLNTKDLSTLEMIVVQSSILNLIPFADLYTSSGRTLQDIVASVQILPCISVLRILEACYDNSLKEIRVLGNPEMVNIPETSFRKPSKVQLDLLEEELTDVSVLLGVKAEVGVSATKEHFLREFSSTSLLHLSTYGSHEDGVIALAPVLDKDPRAVSDDSWAITLEDIVALREGPSVVVLNSCYGCQNRFHELHTFDLSIPLALMVAGVKAVVMPTWSIPQKVLLASLREFYRNLSNVNISFSET